MSRGYRGTLASLPSGLMLVLRLTLAASLGLLSALLLACGAGTSNLIPTGASGALKTDFQDVATAVSNGDCNGVATALAQAQRDLATLPPSVDPVLKRRLSEGLDNLRVRAPTQCAKTTTATSTPSAITTDSSSTTTAQSSTSTTTTDTTASSTAPQSTPQQSTPTPDNGGGAPAPSNGNGDNGNNGGAGAGK